MTNSTKQIFYWYVESKRDPENDPVVYWTNGGPGCSGLYGFGTEMGPYYFQEDGTVKSNPYAWNNIANMLYVEQPAGVGFSYSLNEDDYTTGDAQAASDAYDLVVAFFEKFPERKPNEFYITSESYGGHYMPQMSLEILKRDVNKEINFKGFAVGNPWVEPIATYITMYQLYYHHGLVKQSLYDKWTGLGCDTMPAREEHIVACLDYELFMYAGAGYDINPYAVDYPICVDDESDVLQHHFGFLPSNVRSNLWSHQGAAILGIVNPKLRQHVDLYEPCAEDYFTNYLNRDDVQEALHAEETVWSPCSYRLHWDFADRQSRQMEYYTALVTGGYGLKMLVFSGDDDSICSTASTQSWIYDLGVEKNADYDWAIWNVDGQTGGYVTEFELDPASGTFYFATVHAAGHEVPAYKPKEAFDLFERYLTGNWNLKSKKAAEKYEEGEIFDKSVASNDFEADNNIGISLEA